MTMFMQRYRRASTTSPSNEADAEREEEQGTDRRPGIRHRTIVNRQEHRQERAQGDHEYR
jgi:hypothetical protein